MPVGLRGLGRDDADVITACKVCEYPSQHRIRICPGCLAEKYPARTELTGPVLRQAVDLRRYGFSLEEVRRMLGLSITVAALRRALWVAGYRFPRVGRVPWIPKTDVERWREQRRSGMRWKAIAREADRTTSQVYHAVRRLDSIAT